MFGRAIARPSIEARRAPSASMRPGRFGRAIARPSIEARGARYAVAVVEQVWPGNCPALH